MEVERDSESEASISKAEKEDLRAQRIKCTVDVRRSVNSSRSSVQREEHRIDTGRGRILEGGFRED